MTRSSKRGCVRPIHTMRFVSCDSFVLLCRNQRHNSRISEFDRSCVQLFTSCGRPFKCFLIQCYKLEPKLYSIKVSSFYFGSVWEFPNCSRVPFEIYLKRTQSKYCHSVRGKKSQKLIKGRSPLGGIFRAE